MSVNAPIRAALAAGLFIAIPTFALAQATPQQTPPQDTDIVLTPGRSPQSISRSGSAISVIRQDEVDKASAKSMTDLLRQVPGLSVSETGGPGQTTNVRIRGAEARHTLVLIDGIRVNDPSAGGAEFDFSSLVPADIERIEVLRGPQSALYGSDAVGGVINIITRKGRGGPRQSVSIEAGSYGTKIGKAAISGGNQTFDYALSLTGVQSAGFSTYGYRIGRITSQRGWPLEADSFSKAGGSAKFAWRPVQGVEIETGITSSADNSQYDAAFGAFPDTPSRSKSRLATGYIRTTIDLLDGKFRNSFTLLGNQTNRSYNDVTFSDFGFGLTREWDKYAYVGQRGGFEYQGDLKLDAYGKLIFGTKWEEEKLSVRTRPLETAFNTYSRFPANQVTKSVFALYQLPIGERLDVSAGGRIDDVENSARFATWRLTGAYRITELDLKLRASAGTGGKAPSLYQLKSPQYGTQSLQPEHSFGVDAGFDQSLFGGRLLLSVTGFHNNFNNLIDFSPFSLATFSYPVCPVGQRFTGCFVNIARAETNGAEMSADIKLIEGVLSARAVYTHMVATDRTTGKHLARRPEDEGRLSLKITPIDKLTIEPSVFLVGKRWSSANETLRMTPYARFDMRADYQVHDNLNLFARAENLTNAKYQEVYNYGTTGRAFYIGAKAQW